MRWLFLTSALGLCAAAVLAQEEIGPPPPADEEAAPAEEGLLPVEVPGPQETEAVEEPEAGPAEAPPPPEEEAVGIPPIGPELEEAVEIPPVAPVAEEPGAEEAVGVPPEGEDAGAVGVEAAVPEKEAAPSALEAKPVRKRFRPPAREPEPTLTKGLRAGESIALSADKVRGEREVVSLVTEGVTLQFIYTPDGLFEVLSLSGQAGDRASFELVAGQKSLSWNLLVGKGRVRLRCWAIGGFTATAGQSVLSIKLEAFNWAFALVADEVGPEGLDVNAEGLSGVLHDGQRLDSRRTVEEEVVFVISGTAWPREYTPWEMARIKQENGPRTAGEPQQAVHSPLRRWQTLFLPTVEIQVLRPEDVSP